MTLSLAIRLISVFRAARCIGRFLASRLINFPAQFLGQAIDFALSAAKRLRFVTQHALGRTFDAPSHVADAFICEPHRLASFLLDTRIHKPPRDIDRILVCSSNVASLRHVASSGDWNGKDQVLEHLASWVRDERSRGGSGGYVAEVMRRII